MPQSASQVTRADRATSDETPCTPRKAGRQSAKAFTLIELLVVIAIIAILASFSFVVLNAVLRNSRKSEVREMAHQIKHAVASYYAEYGTFPAVSSANLDFLKAMTGSTNIAAVPNRRGIRFLELPAKFTNSTKGIVGPKNLYGTNIQTFSVIVDSNYDGRIILPDASTKSGSVGVYLVDPEDPSKYISTW